MLSTYDRRNSQILAKNIDKIRWHYFRSQCSAAQLSNGNAMEIALKLSEVNKWKLEKKVHIQNIAKTFQI